MRNLRLNDIVAERLVPFRKSTIYRQMASGYFPKPIQVTPTISYWPEADVEEVMNARTAGLTGDELKAVVKEIEERRALRRAA